MLSDVIPDEEFEILRAQGESAAKRFVSTLSAVRQELEHLDPCEVLVRAGFYQIIRGPNRPDKRASMKVELFQLELLQAFALAHQRTTPSENVDYRVAAFRLLHLLDQNAEAYRERVKFKTVRSRQENERQRLLSVVQRWTLGVRGARHEYQTKDYVFGLSAEIDESFRHHHGCSATVFVNALCRILALVDERLQNVKTRFQKWGRKRSGIAMIEAFVADLDSVRAEEIRKIAKPHRHDRDRVMELLWSEFETCQADSFTFRYDELSLVAPLKERQALTNLLRRFAFRFGEISEGDLQHLHLDNPIRLKPLIELDDETILCPSPIVIGVQLAEILESACAVKPSLKKVSEKARSDWLETRLATVVRHYLPSADIREKVKWSDDGGATTWESDLVAVIDRTVLIFEAKSAKISAAARRGAPNSLREALDDLVVSPSRQSFRMKERILNADGPISFDTVQGILTVDPKQVRSIIRVNIVQDAVGPLSSHWPQLAAAGFIAQDVEIAPTMSVHDLESVFEVLSLEIERCHYLHRRAELERNAIYTADEHDLLAVYQECQFNIGDQEFSGQRLEWYGKSLQVTVDYTRNRDAGTLAAGLKRTPFWSALLTSLERRRPPGWTRFGHRLLHADFPTQKKIEALYRKGVREVSRRPSCFFTSGLTFGATKRLSTISVCVGAPDSDEQFSSNLNYAAQEAFEQGGQDNLLALYWYIPRTEEPYDFIGVMRRQRGFGLPLRTYLPAR